MDEPAIIDDCDSTLDRLASSQRRRRHGRNGRDTIQAWVYEPTGPAKAIVFPGVRHRSTSSRRYDGGTHRAAVVVP